METSFLVTDQIREAAHQAAQLVKDNAPDPAPALDKAAKASRRVLGTTARSDRRPLLVAGAVVAVFLLLVRRRRGSK
ncbi:hypothetical protein ACGFZK_08770 [Streptomyces sp. NPDC048257]|uniref:hypothetical protein n=1 Tax=Streptomyces sp. NPDC048257 TaxID=3365526 RepID=UPI0037149298